MAVGFYQRDGVLLSSYKLLSDSKHFTQFHFYLCYIASVKSVPARGALVFLEVNSFPNGDERMGGWDGEGIRMRPKGHILAFLFAHP